MSLVAAHDAGVPASLSTAVYANLIASRQRPDGRWITIDVRPPQSHSEFTATAIAMRAVQLYMPARRAGEVPDRVARASAWLAAAEPRTTEDRVFQLRGLAWAGMDAAHLKPIADRLITQQHADGGWSQLARLDSDAYATGEVLVALREAHIPAADPAWQRGLSYLKRTQKPDGSWLVRSRLHEQRLVSPPYFESGFPYGANQMISCMGTSWATAALLLATDAPRPTAGSGTHRRCSGRCARISVDGDGAVRYRGRVEGVARWRARSEQQDRRRNKSAHDGRRRFRQGPVAPRSRRARQRARDHRVHRVDGRGQRRRDALGAGAAGTRRGGSRTGAGHAVQCVGGIFQRHLRQHGDDRISSPLGAPISPRR